MMLVHPGSPDEIVPTSGPAGGCVAGDVDRVIFGAVSLTNAAPWLSLGRFRFAHFCAPFRT